MLSLVLLCSYLTEAGVSATDATNVAVNAKCSHSTCPQKDDNCHYDADLTVDSDGCLKNPCGIQRCTEPRQPNTVVVVAIASSIIGLILLIISSYCIYYYCCYRINRDDRPRPQHTSTSGRVGTNRQIRPKNNVIPVDASGVPMTSSPQHVSTVASAQPMTAYHDPSRANKMATGMRLHDDERLLLQVMRSSSMRSAPRPMQSRLERAYVAAREYGISCVSARALRDPIDMQSRTFAKSNFKIVYPGTPAVTHQHVLAQAIRGLIDSLNSRRGIPQSTGDEFFSRLQALAFRNSHTDISSACEYLWTSTERMAGTEFSSLINLAIRGDYPLDIVHACVISRCLNSRRVSRSSSAARKHTQYPANGVCYRGTGWREAHRKFYQDRLRKKYRVAGFLATSNSLEIAMSFLYRVPRGQPRVLWTVRFDPRGERDRKHRVKHMSFVAKSLVPGEGEFLFAPYSAFTVTKLKWSSSKDKHHEISLQACIDNLKESEALPLAPWY